MRECVAFCTSDKNNEVLRCAFLDTEDKRICTCGSDGNAIIWTADTTIDSTTSTKQSYTKTLTLPHGDSQIYACETLPCVPTEHVMTAAENQIHVWNLSNEGRDFPIKTLNFDVDSTSSASGELLLSLWFCSSYSRNDFLLFCEPYYCHLHVYKY